MKKRSRRPEPDPGAGGDAKPDPQALERVAVGLLARREHSRAELQNKLTARGFASADIESLLDRLAARQLQSDARFADSYARMRTGRGYGPERVRAELRERGVATALIEQVLGAQEGKEGPGIDEVWHRKFAGHLPVDYRERARQMRFLQQRGFSTAAIRSLFGRLSSDAD